jgi:hypothetical protein
VGKDIDSNPHHAAEAVHRSATGKAGSETDFWRKLEVLLTPLGGLVTAVVVAVLGFKASTFLDREQSRDANLRLYADLISKRETADSDIRKDMFNLIIQTFLNSKSVALEKNLLYLELLAYNFHESIDLAPLFKDLQRHIDLNTPGGRDLTDRLQQMAGQVSLRELSVLGEAGERFPFLVSFDDFGRDGSGSPKSENIDLTLRLSASSDSDAPFRKRHFRVEFVSPPLKRTKEIWVRLSISDFDGPVITRLIKAGFFQFPMIDNIRLSHDQRCAVVLTDFEENNANLEIVYFPGSRASLKEKPYYDDVLHQLVTSGQIEEMHRQ